MTTEVAIAVAVIGAVAGFLGALGGSWIAAGATEAAAKSQREQAEATREETRRLHFDDRIRELTADLLDRAYRYENFVAKRRETTGPLSDPEVDFGYRRARFELELIVRQAKTVTALEALENAQYVIYDFDYQLHGPEGGPGWFGPDVADDDEWHVRSAAHDKALHGLRDAIREELGLERLEAPDPPPIFEDQA